MTLPQVFSEHSASKNQLPGFYISETLVENGLITRSIWNLNINYKQWNALLCNYGEKGA